MGLHGLLQGELYFTFFSFIYFYSSLVEHCLFQVYNELSLTDDELRTGDHETLWHANFVTYRK
jgi:hypothetical protein